MLKAFEKCDYTQRKVLCESNDAAHIVGEIPFTLTTDQAPTVFRKSLSTRYMKTLLDKSYGHVFYGQLAISVSQLVESS